MNARGRRKAGSTTQPALPLGNAAHPTFLPEMLGKRVGFRDTSDLTRKCRLLANPARCCNFSCATISGDCFFKLRNRNQNPVIQ